MKPSSKNEVMNGIVNAYIAQKALDKANNTHYADTWKILNGADDEIDASLTFDLSEGEWDSVKKYLNENKISFALCLISYKDGHSQNSFVWYDDQHIYATEMNEIGSVTFHVIDNVNKEVLKPTDETSSSILKMLLALENGGANGGGGEVTTKQVFKGGVDILDKPLNVESKATFGSDAEVDGKLTINSAKDLVTKDGTGFGSDLKIFEIDFSRFSQETRDATLTSEEVQLFQNSDLIYVKNFGGQGKCQFQKNKDISASFTQIANNVGLTYSLELDDNSLQLKAFSVEIPTDEQLNAKQSTLYRHTITIYEGNTKDKNSICFTAYTPSNTPIDSIQDLTASADGSNKLANTDLECFGVSGTESALVFYNKIHVGTSISNTTLQKVTGGSATLASVYATYTMTDDVTLN